MISNLITDRTQADVSHLRAQREKILNEGWAALSEAEQMEYLAGLKGGYNATDLNRVTHAMEYLVERIRSYGYTVKYEKVKVPHQPQKGKNRHRQQNHRRKNRRPTQNHIPRQSGNRRYSADDRFENKTQPRSDRRQTQTAGKQQHDPVALKFLQKSGCGGRRSCRS